MRPSPWLSATLTRLTRRERVVVAAGAGVSALALLAVLVVLPLARRWSEQRTLIAARAEQMARLQDLLGRADELGRQRDDLERVRVRTDAQLLDGETAGVAASSLQLLLNRYAAESRVSLDRVDAVSQSEAGDGIAEIPARIAVTGDIYGLVDLLFYLQRGERLLVVDELSVQQARPGPRGEELLAASVTLHGYYRQLGGGS